MQNEKKSIKTPTTIKAFFSGFKTLFKKVEQDTTKKQKRSYLDDMAIPRANFRSQFGGYCHDLNFHIYPPAVL